LKEIINVAKTVKTTGLTVYLGESVSSDADVARLVCSMLEYTVLGDITKLTEIYYDPDITNTVVPKDREFVKLHYEFSDDTQDDLRRYSPWVLRIELNPTVFLEKKMQMSEIVNQIKQV
jgi:DNA-directed RNA polymerase II subunit RPB1